MWQRIAYRH